MCKAVKCPQCGHEFTPERAAVKTGAWTPEEDELLLRGYQLRGVELEGGEKMIRWLESRD